jgi:hypothetical protein
LLLGLAGATARADERLHLSSFGTLGYTTDTRPDIAPARDIAQLPQDSYATGPSWRLDTRLGMQLEYSPHPSVDLVGQWVVRDEFRRSLDSITELAYVGWRPDTEWDIRAGRINYDAFLMSDHRNVGYAYPWVRPPSEFYGWIPILSVNGLDAGYRFETDAVRWRLKAQVGNSSVVAIPIGSGYDLQALDLRGLSLTGQTDHWRFKLAHSRLRVANEVPAFAPLFAGLDAVAAAGLGGVSTEAADLRTNLSFQDARISYTTLGAAYDDGQWLMQAEWGLSTASVAVVPHGRMAYFSVGRRVGDWTPLVTLSSSRPDNAPRTAATDWGAYNASLRDPALYVLNTNRIDQDTLSLGLRWDFHRQAALKLQWDQTLIRPSGYGLWWRDITLNNDSSRINLLSLTLDFTF